MKLLAKIFGLLIASSSMVLGAPVVLSTSVTTNLVAPGGMKFNAIVNPSSIDTLVWFQYGGTTNYGSVTSVTDIGSGSGNITVSLTITNLNPSGIYNVQVIASNTFSGVTVKGQNITATNPPLAVVTYNGLYYTLLNSGIFSPTPSGFPIVIGGGEGTNGYNFINGTNIFITQSGSNVTINQATYPTLIASTNIHIVTNSPNSWTIDATNSGGGGSGIATNNGVGTGTLLINAVIKHSYVTNSVATAFSLQPTNTFILPGTSLSGTNQQHYFTITGTNFSTLGVTPGWSFNVQGTIQYWVDDIVNGGTTVLVHPALNANYTNDTTAIYYPLACTNTDIGGGPASAFTQDGSVVIYGLTGYVANSGQLEFENGTNSTIWQSVTDGQSGGIALTLRSAFYDGDMNKDRSFYINAQANLQAFHINRDSTLSLSQPITNDIASNIPFVVPINFPNITTNQVLITDSTHNVVGVSASSFSGSGIATNNGAGTGTSLASPLIKSGLLNNSIAVGFSLSPTNTFTLPGTSLTGTNQQHWFTITGTNFSSMGVVPGWSFNLQGVNQFWVDDIINGGTTVLVHPALNANYIADTTAIYYPLACTNNNINGNPVGAFTQDGSTVIYGPTGFAANSGQLEFSAGTNSQFFQTVSDNQSGGFALNLISTFWNGVINSDSPFIINAQAHLQAFHINADSTISLSQSITNDKSSTINFALPLVVNGTSVFTNLTVTGTGIVATQNLPNVGTNLLLATDTSHNIVGVPAPSGGLGTVTSVAMTVPAWFSISGSPITTSGTFGLTQTGVTPLANSTTNFGPISATTGTYSNILTVTLAPAANTISPGLTLISTGVATSGNPINSPVLTFSGQTYDSSGATTKTATWSIYEINQTASGGGSILVFTNNLNTTSFTYNNGNVLNVGRIQTSAAGNSFNDMTISGKFATHFNKQSGNYTLVSSDYIVISTGTGNTFTLPTAVGISGQMYMIKDGGTGGLTLATTSSQTIFDTSATTTLAIALGGSVTVVSDNANWYVIAH